MITATVPTKTCINPVAGKSACLEYAFVSSDGVLQECTFATTTIQVSDIAIPINEGITFNIDGQIITLVNSGNTTLDGYTIIEPNADSVERGNRLLSALQANSFIANNYTIELTPSLPNTANIVLTARNCGSSYNLNADTITGGNHGYLKLSNVEGVDADIKEDHNVKLSFYCIDNGEEVFLEDKLYPTKQQGTELRATINIADTLEDYLTYQVPNKNATGIYPIKNVTKTFKVYYSEVFTSETINDGKPQSYFNIELDTIGAINGVTQGKNPVDYADFCKTDNTLRFITNMPLDGTINVCCDACLFLSFYIANNPSSLSHKIIYHYKDGTDSGIVDLSTLTFDENCRLYTAPLFLENAPNNEQLQSIETWIERDGLKSETAYFTIFNRWGKKQAFFFFNELGGIDTIYFDCQTLESMQVEYFTVCDTVDCNNETYQGGNQTIASDSQELYSTISQKHYSYQDKEWLKEFYRQPRKWTIENGQLCTVNPQSGTYQILTGGKDNVYSTLIYSTNIIYETQNG